MNFEHSQLVYQVSYFKVSTTVFLHGIFTAKTVKRNLSDHPFITYAKFYKKYHQLTLSFSENFAYLLNKMIIKVMKSLFKVF